VPCGWSLRPASRPGSVLARSPSSPTWHQPETLRNWVAQAEIDHGQRAGVPTAERQRIAELEREVRELRRANDILKAASAFFAAELDRPRTR
jgi:transposase